MSVQFIQPGVDVPDNYQPGTIARAIHQYIERADTPNEIDILQKPKGKMNGTGNNH